MNWTQSQSNGSLDDVNFTASKNDLNLDTSGTVNARFIAYLQQVYAPRDPRKLSLMTAGIISGTCLAALVTLILVRELHTVWPLFPLSIAIIARVVLSLHHRLGTRHLLHRVRDVIETGTPVTGYLVQAPPALFRPGTDNLPCLALFSFQPEVGNDTDYMQHLATRLYDCKDSTPRHSEERYLASLTLDDLPVLYRRRLLPFSFTDGSVVYCADIWVNRAYIRDGYLSSETLPLLAQVGHSGGVELIPWWLTAPDPVPSASALPNLPAKH